MAKATMAPTQAQLQALQARAQALLQAAIAPELRNRIAERLYFIKHGDESPTTYSKLTTLCELAEAGEEEIMSKKNRERRGQPDVPGEGGQEAPAEERPIVAEAEVVPEPAPEQPPVSGEPAETSTISAQPNEQVQPAESVEPAHDVQDARIDAALEAFDRAGNMMRTALDAEPVSATGALVNTAWRSQAELIQTVLDSKGASLPADIRAVLPILTFSEGKAAAYKILVQQVHKLPEAEQMYREALASGQKYGEAALYAHMRIGQLARETPQVQTGGIPVIPRGTTGQEGEAPKHERLGLTKKQMHVAETLAAHPEAVEAVVQEAQAGDEIPTRAAVLRKVRQTAGPRPAPARKPAVEMEGLAPAEAEYLDRMLQAYAWILRVPAMSAEGRRQITDAWQRIVKKLAELMNTEEKT